MSNVLQSIAIRTSAMDMANRMVPTSLSWATGFPGRASRMARKPSPSNMLKRKKPGRSKQDQSLCQLTVNIKASSQLPNCQIAIRDRGSAMLVGAGNALGTSW